MMRRSLPLFLILALLLTGCSTVVLGNGTLSVDADAITKIEITSGIDGYTFTVQDRDSITQLVRYMNSFDLSDGTAAASSWNYSITGYDAKGDKIAEFVIVDETTVCVDGQTYSVNAASMCSYTEKLECATLTDNALIDRLFTTDTLDKLNILNEDGKISLDKIAGLSDSCPALFALIKRPSVITSVGSYGLDALSKYLNSDNIAIKERAETIAALFEEYFPDLQEKIENIVKNNENNA